MKKYIKLLCSFVILFTMILSILTVSAESYNYNYEKVAVKSPDVATVYTVLNDLDLNNPSDIAVDSNGYLYIADTDGKRIVVLDREHKFLHEIKKAGKENLNTPTGIFIDENDNLYISDMKNEKIIVCDKKGKLIRTITATAEEVYAFDFVFAPKKACADEQGNTFVISDGVYDGLMQFDKKGKFVGFVGANEVNVGLWDLIWKNLSTKSQREKSKKDIPTEFDGLDIDPEGFVYTVTSTIEQTNPEAGDPVRKQTALGINIIKPGTVTGKPIGDIEFPYWNKDAMIEGASSFIDVAVSDYGYLCLDNKRGRIFCYNENNDIMFILGGYGAKKGCFTKPVAIEVFEDKIFVLDNQNESITVFNLSDYGKFIIDAQQQYIDGEYGASAKSWKQVLTLNSNSSLAYVGLGKVYLMQGNYTEAMKYLKLGGDKEFYSKAFGLRSQELIADNLIYIFAFIIILIIALIFWLKLRNKNKKTSPLNKYDWYKGFKYGFYIMIHPFDGYWDMTHEKKGCMKSGIIIYILYIFSWIFEGQFTGFLYSSQSEFELIKTLGIAVIPVVLWCLCNWAVSTLLDGEGKPSAIVLSTAYALLPYMIVKYVSVVLSNMLTLEQSMFIIIPTAFALIWTAFLLFSSVVTIHCYSAKQAIGTILLIIFAMAIVLFLAILVINLVQQMAYFVISIYSQLII